jgi:hypothetical protein
MRRPGTTSELGSTAETATFAALGVEDARALTILCLEHPADVLAESSAYAAICDSFEDATTRYMGARDAAWARRIAELALDYAPAFDALKAAIGRLKGGGH